VVSVRCVLDDLYSSFRTPLTPRQTHDPRRMFALWKQ
jgi:hypothetical protein